MKVVIGLLRCGAMRSDLCLFNPRSQDETAIETDDSPGRTDSRRGGSAHPFAKQATAFHGVPAVDLGKLVVSEMLARTDLDPMLIDQLVFGQVVQMPEAPNIAGIVLGTGMSVSTDAYSVSRACATSSRRWPMSPNPSWPARWTSPSPAVPTPLPCCPSGSASLWPAPWWISTRRATSAAFQYSAPSPEGPAAGAPAVAEYSTGLSMGQTAEQMAKTHQISREAQDTLAHRSHTLAAEAWAQGKLSGEVFTAHVPLQSRRWNRTATSAKLRSGELRQAQTGV